jgi:hypothetical protein
MFYNRPVIQKYVETLVISTLMSTGKFSALSSPVYVYFYLGGVKGHTKNELTQTLDGS